MKKIKIADLSELNDREPAYALVANVDLVIIRYDDEVSVFYGRCHHRGALLADGYIDGENLNVACTIGITAMIPASARQRGTSR